ncbi:MAG: glycosyltransferase [Endozoicomonas sp.]
MLIPETLSVIVPLGPGEPSWPDLFGHFSLLPAGSEIVLIGCFAEQRPENLDNLPASLQKLNWIWDTSEKGRAFQLNAGAKKATGKYLWFLHADSLLSDRNIHSLLTVISESPGRLYYFDLWFHDKQTPLLTINEWGARIRSNWFGAPFGDQGLCISKSQFMELGGYPEAAPYGEDHLWVWKARQHGIQLQPCHSKLATSARKYHEAGWLSLTLKYQRLWLKQAFPQCLKLLSCRSGKVQHPES